LYHWQRPGERRWPVPWKIPESIIHFANAQSPTEGRRNPAFCFVAAKHFVASVGGSALSLSFDQHAFAGKRARPVSKTTGISFEDYSRMETFSHKSRAERRNETPIWARNNALLISLLVRFMENRAQIAPGTGTDQERLERAARQRKRKLPELKRTLKKLCARYVKLRRPKRKRVLGSEIEAIDSSIVLIKRGEACVVLRCIYLYYRSELNSVAVSQEIGGIKPPAVRQLLWKLNRVWEKEFTSHKQAFRSV
jgi:hypothetical protein